jgi:uncharacterized protein (TIGR02231 family)
MKALLALAVLLPGAAWADIIVANSRVTAVTIYPQGAQVTREVVFTAPAGVHEVLITDLPEATEAGLLRVSSQDTDLGSFALREDRLPPREDMKTPEDLAAEEAVKVAKVALHGAEAKVAGIRAEVEAQEAQIAFLTAVRLDDTVATAEGISGVSQMIGTEVLTARMAALAAQAGLAAAEEEVAQAQEDLAAAEEAMAALAQRDEGYVALSVAITSTGGEGRMVVSHYVYDASWAPVYDMALDRKAGTLAVERGVLVSQYSGEDWRGVALTLSTARPSEQSAPTGLWPELRRVEEPEPPMDMAKMSDGMAGEAMAAMEEPVVAAVVGAATAASVSYQGDTVVYDYPTTVDLASGVENLRLALDEVSFAAKVTARAVPRYDQTAFVVATVVNSGTEILLPGEAYLYRDGALTGMVQLDSLSPGDEVDLGFGAIDGIRLTRDMPERAEGDRGVFTASTQIAEKAVLEVENLTDEAWPVRVLDLVPYSEQEELEITYSAVPAVSEIDVDGKRGVLAWDFDLAPGETKAITLDSLLSWPEGKVLQ